MSVKGGLSDAGQLTLCTATYCPLSVSLDLDRASGQSIGVKQQVAGLGLDVLPVVGTRGSCEHRDVYIYS